MLCCTLLLSSFAVAQSPGKTLLVVAHPDDEYYFAATVYRMATQLHGQVDELIITDGEGGFRYSTLAEPYYKKSLTVEAIGREDLPAIRREEALNAGRILGIKEHFFLNQKDDAFTTDEEDGPKHGWDAALIRGKIETLIKKEHYQYVFSILPRTTTHGHHQAATALAALAIHDVPENIRPVLFGFDTDATDFIPSRQVQHPQGWRSTYAYAFDRTTKFGFHDALSYQIVVDWMIAEHKSQGLLQTMCGKDPKEYVWVDFASAPNANAAANSLFGLLDFGAIHQAGFSDH
ncbi:LmbE family N-acetylglucosaminyl deacetylase [Silvibacterium bohemicum]|uniref:LmbE family N-acetylglucosaminyl deacetylase n=2 Tax=Silvibacterium bohemicum TaxID=1577686 RepID=A0A841K1J5_9BACT|nr:LmbE family N-acetylglucosaminyl deacetylase [Silvibacterium bohemicum]